MQTPGFAIVREARASIPLPPQGQQPASSTRQIKAAPFTWQANLALDLIEQHFPRPKMTAIAASGIYAKLTQLASEQRTPGQCHTSCAYLAARCDLGEACVRRYLHEFEQIGLLRIIPGSHAANTYLLMPVIGEQRAANEPTSSLEAASLPLADKQGVSINQRLVGRGIMGDPPPTREAIPHDRLAAPRSILQDRQYITKGINKEREQPDRVGGDQLGIDHSSLADEQPAQAATPPAAASTQIPHQGNSLTDEQHATAQRLTAIGVQRKVAQQLVLTCSAEAVSGWLEYTRNAKGITSPAGFVLAKLRAGDEPPRPSQPAASWIAEQRKRQEEEARRLLTRYGVDQPTLAVWLAVLDRLQAKEQGAYLCFKDALLARPDARTALLVLPSRVPLEQAASFTSLLLALLASHMGADVQLRFEHPRPGDEPINFAAEADEPPTIAQALQPEPALAVALDQPATTWMEQVWVAASDDLRHLVGNDLWHSWLAGVRLVGRDGDCWLLRQPSGNVPAVLAERWGEQIAALLAAVYGRVVRLRFMAG